MSLVVIRQRLFRANQMCVQVEAVYFISLALNADSLTLTVSLIYSCSFSIYRIVVCHIMSLFIFALIYRFHERKILILVILFQLLLLRTL